MTSTMMAQAGGLRPFFLGLANEGRCMGIEKRGSCTELHLRTAIEQSPLATAILDPDGRCLLVNDAWNALWGSGVDGLPKGSSVFESERLRTMGLTAYLQECRQNGEVSTPLLFREATPERRLR